MKPDDIKPETFYEAFDAALKGTSEDKRKTEFISALTRNLIHCLTLEGNDETLTDPKLATAKIQRALEAVQEDKGIEHVISSRMAVRIAFEHQLASRMTHSDMPPSVKKSGLYKLDLPRDIVSKEE